MLKVVHKYNLLLSIFVVFVVMILCATSAHAADSASMDATVIIKPSLTLNIPSNTITMNLDPATHNLEEQDLVVKVGTNSFSGYKLYVNTTGTNLVNVSDNSKTIPNLTSSASAASFPANNWGYRITQDSTTSSGNYGQFTSGSIISESTGPVNEKITALGFAAKVDYTKPSGLYKLNLEFKALPIVTQDYIQDITTATCPEEPTVVVDKRDENQYTIRKLADGKCWMVSNLRFTGTTLDSTTSNVASTYTPSNPYVVNNATTFDGHNDYYDLITDGGSGGKCNGADSGSGSGYTYACLYKGSNAYSGGETVWYNYAAASAGTIYGSSNTSTLSYSICPKGWRIPSGSEFTAILSYFPTTFNAGYGGYYSNATTIETATKGIYWASAVNSGTPQRRIFAAYSSVDGTYTSAGFRRNGFYVRCIAV